MSTIGRKLVLSAFAAGLSISASASAADTHIH